MPRARKLTPEQHRALADRSLLYLKLRIEAAKHSPYQLAKEFGVDKETIRAYINRKIP